MDLIDLKLLLIGDVSNVDGLATGCSDLFMRYLFNFVIVI